ncbi:uncharacterized protein LOC133721907 isoform X3 [Rosa rugosa]|uniref:uncharacterized protein LOC133721907 isoform X3 n=1 Tax=Rosa rugosa TaxID=74645 RepID=UPI002B410813|nr:uncharacterized protein LOC133721907 isoform X3 [Rosa rugosa]
MAAFWLHKHHPKTRLQPRVLLRDRLLEGPAGDRVPASGGRGREEETEGGVAGEEMRRRQEATGIRIRRRNRVELREEENQKKERKMEREEDDSVSEVLRDRFRLSTISIADAEVFNSSSPSSEEKRHGDIGTRGGLHFRLGLQIYWSLCFGDMEQ